MHLTFPNLCSYINKSCTKMGRSNSITQTFKFQKFLTKQVLWGIIYVFIFLSSILKVYFLFKIENQKHKNGMGHKLLVFFSLCHALY